MPSKAMITKPIEFKSQKKTKKDPKMSRLPITAETDSIKTDLQFNYPNAYAANHSDDGEKL